MKIIIFVIIILIAILIIFLTIIPIQKTPLKSMILPVHTVDRGRLIIIDLSGAAYQASTATWTTRWARGGAMWATALYQIININAKPLEL